MGNGYTLYRALCPCAIGDFKNQNNNTVRIVKSGSKYIYSRVCIIHLSMKLSGRFAGEIPKLYMCESNAESRGIKTYLVLLLRLN